ncbi:MAG: NAD-dependent epimerase/dehydratase family protein [Chloroflexi bacterium]|nr:NAD-dependent epimerase/dehydratase family protein [Chloroflexota bacterium]
MGAVLVTGAAGFIGGHVAELLLKRGERVVGLDNFDPYYSPEIKRRNAARLTLFPAFSLHEMDIRQARSVMNLIRAQGVDRIVHLAALAGVRASIERAAEYHEVNVGGTVIIMDAARKVGVKQFVLASTSSVYGATERIPFVESDPADRPLAPYPATKRAAELMANAYHNLFGLNVTCVRLFTAYGPRVRPDMMLYLVAESAARGNEVTMFGDGDMRRDWTYVSDIAAGIVAALDRPLGYEVINLGRGEPVLLADFVRLIEKLAGSPARIVHRPAPPSEPPITFADIAKARQWLDYDPQVSVEEGLGLFWEWFSSL